MDITPQPSSTLWNNNLPRFVGRAGKTLDAQPDTINVNDASVYEPIIAQSGPIRSVIAFDNESQQIQMENEERWRLNYKLTSANTDPISVIFYLYFDGKKVVMERNTRFTGSNDDGYSA